MTSNKRYVMLLANQGVLTKGTPIQRIGLRYVSCSAAQADGFLISDVDTNGKDVRVNMHIAPRCKSCGQKLP